MEALRCCPSQRNEAEGVQGDKAVRCGAVECHARMDLDQGDASLPKDVAGRKRGHDSKIWLPSQKMALPPKGWGGRAEFGGF